MNCAIINSTVCWMLNKGSIFKSYIGSFIFVFWLFPFFIIELREVKSSNVPFYEKPRISFAVNFFYTHRLNKLVCLFFFVSRHPTLDLGPTVYTILPSTVERITNRIHKRSLNCQLFIRNTSDYRL